MAAQPTIESVMTPYPYSIEQDAHAASAKALMAQLRIHHLPVKEGDVVVGVVSDWGIRKAQELGWDVSVSGNARVRDVCSKDVHTIPPDEPLVNVLMAMAEKHLEIVVIVKNGKLAGIFTSSDACRHYAELLNAQKK